MRCIPFVSQSGNSDCGIAVISMIFGFYGLKVDTANIGSKVNIKKEGISLAEMKQIVYDFGFEFHAYYYGGLQEILDVQLPVVMCKRTNHYIIVERRKKNGYLVLDPARGKGILSFEELVKLYKDVIVVIRPG